MSRQARIPLASQIEELALVTWRQARRVAVFVMGSTVVLMGAAMVVLPGPGLLVIPLGLGILALEFAFARRWLARLRKEAERVRAYLPLRPASKP